MIEIQSFDPHAASAAQWAEYNAFRRIRAEEDDPGDPVQADADFRHDTMQIRPLHRTERMIARLDGQIVGSCGAWLRREGTPDFAEYAPYAYVWGGVRKPWRRRGVGTALARALLGFMDANGKTLVTMSSHQPEGTAFLQAIGAVEKNRGVINHLPFAGLDWGLLQRWLDAAPLSDGLRWEIHTGRVPLPRLAHLMPYFTTLIRDMPRGALESPPPRFEKSGYVTWYADLDRTGGEHLVILLMHDEDVAGVSESSWTPRFPDRAYQELTAVARPWRGRGLAKALKARTLLLMRERHPQVRLMSTSNGESNPPILAINARLGAQVHRRDSTFQLAREALAGWLQGRG